MRRIRREPKINKDKIDSNNFLHLDKIDRIYYINLEKRKDRKESIEKQIIKLDPKREKTERINAIEDKKGDIGCGKSHILTLQKAIENEYENILILEDDFILEKNMKYLNECINDVFSEQKDYDVFLLGRNLRKSKKISRNLLRVYNSLTTSGYLINKKFFHTLKECFEDAVKLLSQGVPNRKAAIDVKWLTLQNDENKFLTSQRRLGYQLLSYSDIEKTVKDYRC